MTQKNSNQLSEELLLAMKMQADHLPLTKQLAAYSMDRLQADLQKDTAKKAFWINIYNAYFLILRKIEKLDKPAIYRQKAVNIAGHDFSLDDIEHGILRKYRYKFSLGYLPNPFAPRMIKKLAVKKIDYRIHFALNCGAESCPPIAFYSADHLDQELEMATLSFLEGDTEVLSDKKEIHISRLFLWFRGDIAGKRGIRRILQEKLKVNASAYKLIYKEYEWEEDLNNFVEGI